MEVDDVLWEGFGPLLCFFMWIWFVGFLFWFWVSWSLGFSLVCQNIDLHTAFSSRKERATGNQLGEIYWETGNGKTGQSSKQARSSATFCLCFCFFFLVLKNNTRTRGYLFVMSCLVCLSWLGFLFVLSLRSFFAFCFWEQHETTCSCFCQHFFFLLKMETKVCLDFRMTEQA